MFINIPEDYSSMWGELTYHFTISEPRNLLVEIINGKDDSIIAVKKFYSCAEIKFNIAHIIRQNILPEPTSGETGFSIADLGFINVYVRIDSIVSESRTFILAHERPSTFPTLLTTMPEGRVLHPSESDSLLLITDLGNRSTARLTAVARDTSTHNNYTADYYTLSRNAEFHTFTVNADEFNTDYQSIEVTITTADQGRREIYYTLTPPNLKQNGYRVAWLSKEGSIESYTFPLISNVTQLSNGKIGRSLRSAYGTIKEVEALSEVIHSPRVWHINDDGSKEAINVTTTQYPKIREGTLSIANIDIEEYGKSFN